MRESSYSMACGADKIQQGRRPWSTSSKDLKDEMLRPTDQLVTQVSPIAARGFTEKQQTCRQCSFGKNGCPRKSTCQYRHICANCADAGTYTDGNIAKRHFYVSSCFFSGCNDVNL